MNNIIPPSCSSSLFPALRHSHYCQCANPLEEVRSCPCQHPEASRTSQERGGWGLQTLPTDPEVGRQARSTVTQANSHHNTGPHPTSCARQARPTRVSTGERLSPTWASRPGNGRRLCTGSPGTKGHILESASSASREAAIQFLPDLPHRALEARRTFRCSVNSEELGASKMLFITLLPSSDLFSDASDGFIMTKAPAGILNKPKYHHE